MSILKERVDYKYLEEELHQALRDDELYQLQNDAKIRAVEQRVPTYNDFREMVNAAHLKPLEYADIKKRIPKSMNSLASQSDDWSMDFTILKNFESLPQLPRNYEKFQITTPKDTKEFMSTWKKIMDSNSKFKYLLDSRMYLGKKIFLTEVPSEFLEEVIDLCSKQLLNHEIKDVIDLCIKLSQSNRFELNLIFLNDESKDILRRLLKELISTEVNGYEELSERYKTILR